MIGVGWSDKRRSDEGGIGGEHNGGFGGVGEIKVWSSKA